MKHTQVTYSFQEKRKYYSHPRSLSWPLSPAKGSNNPKLTSKLKGSWSADTLCMDGFTQLLVNRMRLGISMETHFWVCLWVSRKVSLGRETYSENRQHYLLFPQLGGGSQENEKSSLCFLTEGRWSGATTCMALGLT